MGFVSPCGVKFPFWVYIISLPTNTLTLAFSRIIKRSLILSLTHALTHALVITVLLTYFLQATDLEITARLMLHTKEVLNTYMANFCDQPIDKLRADTDRDFYLTPEEALAYGLIDEVIQHKRMIPTPKIPSLKVS